MLSPLPGSPNGPAASQSKRRIYLHIGAPKTGSTALQYYLYENRDLLRQQGYSYPTGLNLTMAKAHHPLYFAVAGTWWHPDFYYDITGERLPEGTYRKKYRLEDCRRELRFAAAASDNLILSSEGFFDLDQEGVELLRELLSAYEVSVFVYLRRQDEFIEAMYRHYIVDSGARFREPIDQYLNNGLVKRCSYLQKVDTWAECFGMDYVNVVPYETSTLNDGDIARDFLGRIGLDTDNFPGSQRINVSQPNDTLQVLSLANMVDWERREDAADFARFLRESFESDGEVWPMLSASQKIEFLDPLLEENQELARKYLRKENGQLFDVAHPEPSDQQTLDRGEVERAKVIGLLSRSCDLLTNTPSTNVAEIVLATTALFKAARNTLCSETKRRSALDQELRGRLDRAEGELEVCHRETEQHRCETQQTRGEVERLNKMAELARSEVESLRNEIETTRLEKERFQREAGLARSEAKSLRSDIETMRRERERVLREAEQSQIQTQQARKETERLREEASVARGQAQSLQQSNQLLNGQLRDLFWLAEKHMQKGAQAREELHAIRCSLMYRLVVVPTQYVSSRGQSVVRLATPGKKTKGIDRTGTPAAGCQRNGLRYALRHPKKVAVQVLAGLRKQTRFALRQPRKAVVQAVQGLWLSLRYALRQPRKSMARVIGVHY